MTTERYTRKQFEAALDATGLPFVLSQKDSEYVYAAPVEDTNKRIVVRSSVSPESNIADGTGKDSIRIWVEYRYRNNWRALGKGGKHHLTRLPGWQSRLQEEVQKNIDFAIADSEKAKAKTEPVAEVETPLCPECGTKMQVKTNCKKRTKFWGCPNYFSRPRCYGTRQYTEAVQVEEKAEPVKALEIEPSRYQKALLDFVLNSSGNAVVAAEPGSGKSTSIRWMLPYLPKSLRVAVLAFNKKIADAFKQSVAGTSSASVSTTHSLGWHIITRNIRGAKFDQYKVVNRVDLWVKRLRETGQFDDLEFADTLEAAKWAVSEIVSLLKNTLMQPTNENVVFLIQRYNISVAGLGVYWGRFLGLIQEIYNAGLPQNTKTFDFDDMIFWPAISDFTFKKFDLVFVDELQDLNEAQAVMISKITRRVIGVGDSKQSIYGFRGADVEAIKKFVARFDAEILPLSVSYRLPTRHIEHLNQTFGSEIEAAPGAIEGTIDSVTEWFFARNIEVGDVVLCRTNAPLVPHAYRLLRAGVKAIILGKNIGRGLVRLIEGQKAENLADLAAKLNAYKATEMARLQEQMAPVAAEMLGDKVETILSIAENVDTIEGLTQEIDKLFSDEREGVTLSTVHKFKGSEAQTVWIIKPEDMPHPRAEQDWEREQERNVQFVAYSRSKEKLYTVITDQQ